MYVKDLFDPRFDGRIKNLEEEPRYLDPKKRRIMFYRSNLWLHSQRVLGHVSYIAPTLEVAYGNKFDMRKARAIAAVHDDYELIVGDILLQEKEAMSPDEEKILREKEIMAARKMVERYGETVDGYSYFELMLAAIDKNCLEAKVVSLCDKFDAGGEAWHEVHAGNNYFLKPAGGKNRRNGGYVSRIRARFEDFPELIPLLDYKSDMFWPRERDWDEVCWNGGLHTEKTIMEDSGYPPYEHWKKSVAKSTSNFHLVHQVEFMPTFSISRLRHNVYSGLLSLKRRLSSPSQKTT